MRLARWPAVRRIERLLAGEPPPDSGASDPETRSSGGAPPAGGSRHAAGSPGNRLATSLWAAGQRRLAGAVEAAAVRLSENDLILEFSPEDRVLASFAEHNLDELTAACRESIGSEVRPNIKIEGHSPDEGGSDGLMDLVLKDPGVVLVRKIIGGDVVSVVADGDPN